MAELNRPGQWRLELAKEISHRLRNAFDCPRGEAVKGTFELVSETLALVSQRYPHLDTVSVQ